jgi:hypothetical protein
VFKLLKEGTAMKWPPPSKIQLSAYIVILVYTLHCTYAKSQLEGNPTFTLAIPLQLSAWTLSQILNERKRPGPQNCHDQFLDYLGMLKPNWDADGHDVIVQ